MILSSLWRASTCQPMPCIYLVLTVYSPEWECGQYSLSILTHAPTVPTRYSGQWRNGQWINLILSMMGNLHAHRITKAVVNCGTQSQKCQAISSLDLPKGRILLWAVFTGMSPNLFCFTFSQLLCQVHIASRTKLNKSSHPRDSSETKHFFPFLVKWPWTKNKI